MKGKNNSSRERKQPKPLPAPLNEQNREIMLPFLRLASSLGGARMKVQGVNWTSRIDSINWLHHRVIALSYIVGEAGRSGSESEFPGEALATVMGIIREDIEVARVLVNESYRNSASGDTA